MRFVCAEAAEHGPSVGEVDDRGLLRGPGRSAWGRRCARTARRSRRRTTSTNPRGDQEQPLPPRGQEAAHAGTAPAGVVDPHSPCSRSAARREDGAVGLLGRRAVDQSSSATVCRRAEACAGRHLPGRTTRSGGSTRSPGRPRPRTPGTPRARGPSGQLGGRLDPAGVLAELVAERVAQLDQRLAPADRARRSVGSPWYRAARSRYGSASQTSVASAPPGEQRRRASRGAAGRSRRRRAGTTCASSVGAAGAAARLAVPGTRTATAADHRARGRTAMFSRVCLRRVAAYRPDVSVRYIGLSHGRTACSRVQGRRERAMSSGRAACSSSPSSACSTRPRCTGTSCASGSTPCSGRSGPSPTARSTPA